MECCLRVLVLDSHPQACGFLLAGLFDLLFRVSDMAGWTTTSQRLASAMIARLPLEHVLNSQLAVIDSKFGMAFQASEVTKVTRSSRSGKTEITNRRDWTNFGF
jgi:hypothetical protein